MINSVSIREALPGEMHLIQDFAYRIWPVTYGKIISGEQLDYMLKKFYSLDDLNNTIAAEHHYLLAFQGDRPVGFASYLHQKLPNQATKIPKIYILPEEQGLGIGKQLISYIEDLARKNNSEILYLNVNRKNPAIAFYEKIGFVLSGEEDIQIGDGYLMEDYVMVKTIA